MDITAGAKIVHHRNFLQVDFDGIGSDLSQTTISEHKHRRTGFNHGSSVRLADGMLWKLPRIDLALLITSPKLRIELSKAFRLADDIRDHQEDNKEYAFKLMIYHAQMANIGILLLQTNYHLDDENWKQLLRFSTSSEMFVMTLQLSQEIAATMSGWMPLFLTSGADVSDDLPN